MNSDKKAGKCPMELAMELISRKWVIQILRDMFFGKKRFNEFKEGKPNLSNKVLSNCLKEMEENGLISRNSDKNNQSIEYTLTDKGSTIKLRFSYFLESLTFACFTIFIPISFFISFCIISCRYFHCY